MRAVNKYGVPQHCEDCPRIAPTLDALTALDNEKSVLTEYRDDMEGLSASGIGERLEQIEAEVSVRLKHLGELATMTDPCGGVVLTQTLDDEGNSINVIHCGLE